MRHTRRHMRHTPQLTYSKMLFGAHSRNASERRASVLVSCWGGEARSFYVERTKSEDVVRIARKNIAKESRLSTDEQSMCQKVGEDFAAHEAVNHSEKEYVRYEGKGEDRRLITTKTVEGFFSIFKRGMRRVYQHSR